MEKLFYSISEVADILDEPVSTVRFWTNSFPKLLSPKRTAKGNRQYKEEEIDILKQIKYLLKTEGLTLEGAGNRLQADKSGVDRQVKALESLKAIREQLVEIKNSL